MLMILPLLTRTEINYAGQYSLREVFWFGRSSCNGSDDVFCENGSSWVDKEGWYQILRGLAKSSQDNEDLEY